MVHRYSDPEEQYDDLVDAICDYRFTPSTYMGSSFLPGQAECFKLDVPLPDRLLQTYPGEKVLELKYHFYLDNKWPDERCDWEHMHKEA
jgi:hypothetical protein